MTIEWIRLNRTSNSIKPTCSIYKNYLRINRIAAGLFDKEKPYVFFGYDKERNIICIKQQAEYEFGVRKITFLKDGTVNVSIRQFLEYAKIEVDKYIAFCECYKEGDSDNGEYIVCDLNTGTIVKDKSAIEAAKGGGE